MVSDELISPRPAASVAVLLPARDGASWIAAQIQSLLNQRHVSLQLFLSVDPSTDETRKICSCFAEAYDNVTLLDAEPDSGGAAGHVFRMLRSLDVAPYEFVALCDQDDLWCGNKLQQACRLLQETRSAGYSSNVIAFWADGRKKFIRKDYPQRRWDYLFEAAGPGCTYVLTKSFVIELQQFLRRDEQTLKSIHLHDWLIYAFARSRGFPWFIDSTPSLLYRQHHTNVMGANIGWKAMRQRCDTLQSGWALQQINQLCRLLGLDQHPEIRSRYSVRRRGDWLRLAFHAHNCRRRPLDQLAMFGLCVYLFVTGKGIPQLEKGEKT